MFRLRPPHPPIRSQRARRVAQWFGITSPRTGGAGAAEQRTTDVQQLAALLPEAGTITLVSGPSGSGKTSLLRVLREVARHRGIRCLDVDAIRLPDRPLVDCVRTSDLEEALSLLGRVGLGDAWTYLRTPVEISAGQRWRAKLAVAVDRAGRVCEAPSEGKQLILCADEFGAVLDRVTAMIVARAMRRMVRPPLSALLATSHDDLLSALAPDRVIRCDFGNVSVTPPRPTRSS